VFFPEDFARNAKATIFAVLGGSNFVFWRESGYFDVDSLRKPLLHTWSLSVEFQFYAFWPLLIWFIARSLRQGAAAVWLAIIALVSFGGSLFLLSSDAAAAFFLMPTRVWEFAIGGLIVFLEAWRPQRQSFIEIAYIVGLAAVLCCVFGYDKNTLFPGWAAMPPVIGTAMMVYAGASARSYALIDRSWTRFVGRISYSLYLVHWPVLVFALYLSSSGMLSIEVKFSLITLTFSLAALSYYFVETPFRKPEIWFYRKFGLRPACAAVLICFVMPAAYAWSSKGLWAFRISNEKIIRDLNAYDVEAAKNHVWSNYDRFERSSDFQTEKRHVLLIGDSQSADILNMWVDAGVDRDIELIAKRVYFECGVPYLPASLRDTFWLQLNPLTMTSPQAINSCKTQMDQVITLPALKSADVVVVAFLLKEFAKDYFVVALEAIKEQSRGEMWVVGNKAFSESTIKIVNDFGRLGNVERYAATLLGPETRIMNPLLRKNYGNRFVDVMSAICTDDETCDVLTTEMKPIYWDSTHWTPEGSMYVWRRAGKHMFPFLYP
jgi:peptidoglycan/LPS O-acetylase OafA/YrhL